MSLSDIYLMALGPVLALVAGLFIYLAATMGRSNRAGKTLGVGEDPRVLPGQREG